jgi:PPK2 family polyphosphate:nucleotide phosphotransferase
VAKQSDIADKFRITKDKKFRLADFNPADTAGIHSEDEAKRKLQSDIEELQDLQAKLYAQEQWSVLLILQAMDAAGKDSLIKHVMSGMNPTACQVHSFKAPSSEELKHDFLWRSTCRLPERGKIGIFNRSYYEEVLVVRVHDNLLANEKIPPSLVGKKIWRERFEDICSFERYLGRNGTIIRKFFLNVSRKEQKERFLERLDTPNKNWKFDVGDVKERERWSDYMTAYQEMIRDTATTDAPWFVVPADNKWFTQLVVASAIVDTLRDLKLSFPKVKGDRQTELKSARALLERES